MPFNQCHLFSPSSKWKLIARCALVVLQSYLKQIARGKPIEFEEAGYSSLKCECSTSYPHFLDFGSILQCLKENVCHREARGTSAIEELQPTNWRASSYPPPYPTNRKKNILKEMSLDFTYNQVKHRGDTVELKYLYQREKLKKKKNQLRFVNDVNFNIWQLKFFSIIMNFLYSRLLSEALFI